MGRRRYAKGKKLSAGKYIDRLSRTAVVHQIERFSKVTDAAGTLGTNRGGTWLSYGDDASTYNVWDTNSTTFTACTVTQYPIHLFNLCGTRCNPTVGALSGRVGWKLAVTRSGISDKVVWLPLNAYDRNTTVAPDVYPVAANQEWEVEDSGNSNAAGGREIGRNAMLEWTETRVLLYGKKTRPTKVTFSFVSFPDHQFAPDWEYYNDAFGSLRVVDNDAGEYWKTRIQPLVNNPCTVTKRLVQNQPIKILASYTVDIAPKESVDSDTDPNQEFRRWFNRWNRKLNYSFENTAQLTNAQLQDPQVYPNVTGDAPVAGSAKMPYDLKGCVYFMITSYQPDAQAIAADETGPTNAVTASYDFLFRKSTAVMTT